MKNHSLISSVYAALVLSACFIQGFSLPSKSLQRFSSEEFARKFGAAPEDFGNAIDDAALKPTAKEESSLLTTAVELATKIVPLLIGVVSGETGPSQTDRVDGIDLNGEDPFSWRNIVNIGLKVFLAIVSSQSATEKSDGDWLQPVMGAVIEGLTGSNDRAEVSVMAKQAAEVFGLVVSLAQALATSMSQRSFY